LVAGVVRLPYHREGITVYESFEVQLEQERSGIRRVTVYGINGDRQMAFLDTEEFGPFDTDTDIVRWLWRLVSRHVSPARV
jgi:hypothetical protein